MRKRLFLQYIIFLLSLGWILTFAFGVCWGENLPPVFDPIATCYVNEPDTEALELSGGSLEGGTFTTCYVSERKTLEVYVHATDPDGDSISISVLNSPPSALFSELGEGEASLVWMPEFVGPWSSAQSPFELFFVASDGSLSSQLRVMINVINVNRSPKLILPESSQVAAGNQLVFQVRAEDPDLEEVTIKALNSPPEANFDESSGMFDWTPQLADTGLWSITFQATDISGGGCFREAQIRVIPPSTFSLSLGVEESLLGGIVCLPINLVNSDPIAGMELLLQFDPTVFTFLGVSRQDSRTENWEYFTYKEKTWGLYQLVKVVGIADFPNQFSVPPLPPDSGAIAYLSFKVTTDPWLNGLLVPLEFFAFDFTDNTLSTPEGQFIPQESINLTNGGVLLDAGNTLLGDINQNGLPFEVGDAVTLATYLSGITTLTLQQMINSDVNQDGRMAMLADLIFLVRYIMEQETAPEGDGVTPGEMAVVKITKEGSQTSVWLESDRPVGGALVIFKGEDAKLENVKLSPEAKDLDLYTSGTGDEFRVLIISQQAKPLPAGENYLFSFEGEGFDTIRFSLADQEGELLSVQQEYECGSLPTRYALYQNYPNPFNPSTSIKYFVGGDGPAKVSLKIYNVAGQLVKTLVGEEKFPGEYEETWNGRNENNQEVASGVYFYKLKVSDYAETRKMVLLR
jgi:hypothetical protein